MQEEITYFATAYNTLLCKLNSAAPSKNTVSAFQISCEVLSFSLEDS